MVYPIQCIQFLLQPDYLSDTEPKPMHVYLELSPIMVNGSYFQASVDKIAASVSAKDIQKKLCMHNVLFYN